jgi:NADH:ubiquinone oxidoreductase subunit 4 (subunit M)
MFILFLIIVIRDELVVKLLFINFSLFLFIFFCIFFFSIDFSNFELITYSYIISKNYNLIVTVGVDSISIIFSLLTTFIFFISGLIA